MNQEIRNTHFVSYVVATRNRFDKCVKALTSIYRQNGPEKEVVLIDDASANSISDIVLDCFPDVKIFRNERNLGVMCCRNKGADLARGEILIFIDDDAVFKNKDATERILDCFAQDEKVGIVALSILNAYTEKPVRKEIPRWDKKKPSVQTEIAYFTGAGFAVRKKILSETGNFEESFFAANEELDLSFRVIKAGYKIVFLPDVEVLHDSTMGNTPKWFDPYYSLRNRAVIALRYLPCHLAALHISCWTVHSFFVAIRARRMKDFFRALKDFYPLWKKLPQRRIKLSPADIKKIKALSGRIYY